jgi:prepilin-type N-terminal cleavage/methylation domain-containing protein
MIGHGLSASCGRRRRGFTLIEVLIATTLTLMLIGAVAAVFEMVSISVSDARSTVEMCDRLRATAMQLQRDLAGVTVTMLPPRRPEDNEGYFEYVENSILATSSSGSTTRFRPDRVAAATPAAYTPYAIDSETGADDTTVGDTDDILMFTTRSPDRPFVGQFGDPATGGTTIESPVAEVAWFMRGRTLYRRVLLVVSGVTITADSAGFYADYDISVHAVWSGGDSSRLIPNSLSDLTKRECRYAHPYHIFDPVFNRHKPGTEWFAPFPFDVRRWGLLRLPSLRESSIWHWRTGRTLPTSGFPLPQRVTTDLWTGPDRAIITSEEDPVEATANMNLYRVPNPWHPDHWSVKANRDHSWTDAILTNVLAFDVKAWDAGAPLFARTVRGPAGTRTVVVGPGDPGYPGAETPAASLPTPVGYGAYADLGYLFNYRPGRGVPQAHFHVGNYDVANGPRSGLFRVYDTWSTHYEYDGLAQFGGRTDWATDGLDNDGKNGVDDAGERETQPPYPYPLRSIQIRIRVFDPDSRQIREVTVVQNFMPQ